MDHDNSNVTLVAEEDRLSSLPDELGHKILSCFDMKIAVQTCLLSSRWKLLWTSMTSLDFSVGDFRTIPEFVKFVTNVLSHRNHQAEVFSIKLDLCGVNNQDLLKKAADYAFSHNLQELTVVRCPQKEQEGVPPFLLSSHSLKRMTLISYYSRPLCITPNTPWDLPALATLHLSGFKLLCDDNTRVPFDLFSECVNLKNLTLQCFLIKAVEVFNIITPRLSNLALIDGICSKVINVIAPQLENLTIIDCSIKYLNTPTGLPSLCYRGFSPPQLSIDQFHSLNKVAICLSLYRATMPYEEDDACETINMLQSLRSVGYLTLNWDIVECISSFPDLLSRHPSPFSNLICFTIDYRMRKDAYKVEMSSEARNFFLENSPSAKFIMESPKGC